MTMSDVPPGAQGLMILTGRLGQAPRPCTAGAASSAGVASRRWRRSMGGRFR